MTDLPSALEPMGARWGPTATRFAVHVPTATSVQVCLFDDAGDGSLTETRHELREPVSGVWRGVLPGVDVGQRYGLRAAGPWDPGRGRRFDADALLLDPYAQAVTRPPSYGGTGPAAGLGVVVHDEFDWAGDASPGTPWERTVLYELHVKGFTALHEQVPVELRGTYAGLATPAVLAYLVDLGVTAVELMPVHHFVSEPAVLARGQVNYWGYNPVGFFAPHAAYSAAGDRGQQVTELKQMVKELHAAGLEVILDVVFNHTAEGNRHGPTLSLRGLDDGGYYLLEPDGDYVDVTGCGNTVAASRQPALGLVLDSLRYWVTELHVDGFRFDLAPALLRTGHDVDWDSPLLAAIGADPVLATVKLIAEPWDVAAGGYQLGRFPAPWREWNDRYRDTVRDFWRTAPVGARELATRLAGSADLYADAGRSPYASVNLVTAHDGFTLRDLVSYEHKHNEANGEQNRDGESHNRSWNCGVEGETGDPAVEALRRRQAANLMATLCLSTGVPMLTAGDERGRTQGGNNNAYVQDNPVSWLDWGGDTGWQELHALTRAALRLRRDLAARGTPAPDPPRLAWLRPDGAELTDADWEDGRLRTLGILLGGATPQGTLLVWLHAEPEPVRVLLPAGGWAAGAEVVLSTDPGHHVGGLVGAGGPVGGGPVGARDAGHAAAEPALEPAVETAVELCGHSLLALRPRWRRQR